MAQHLELFLKTYVMDNPRKKKEDAKRVSKQTHEQGYQKRKTAKKDSSNNDDRMRMTTGSEPERRSSR